ncbi:MAG: alpha/beta fold hydrolase [Steroidobacteraceae bacterium]|jgi:pimeloyl-ACP methyl ester carboxylesterase
MVPSSERSSDRRPDAHPGGVAAGAPRVRRAYFECRFGQLHVHHVMPAGGGFDEATTVLCIPGAPGSGRAFYGLLLALGRDRSIYAPDLPGSGESDAPPAGAGTAELASALTDFLDSMRFRRVNVIAHGSGGAVALALIEARRGVLGKLVLSASASLALPPAMPVLQLDLGLSGEPGGRGVAETTLQRVTDFLGMN